MSRDTVVIQGAAQPRAGALSLALAAHGVPADALGPVRSVGDELRVSLDERAARDFVTPALLLIDGQACVARRASDLPSEAAVWSLTVQGAHPAGGTLALALFEAAGVLGEDVRTVRRKGADTVVELPLWRYREADLPTSLLGQPVVVEKKKPRSRLSLGAGGSESGAEALRAVIGHELGAVRLRDAIRRSVNGSRGDAALQEAVRRIGERGAAIDAAVLPTTDVGLLLCTQALAPRRSRQKLHGLYRAVPFPGPAERAAAALLDAIHAETSGEPRALWPLAATLIQAAESLGAMTFGAGTLIPGLRSAGLTQNAPEEQGAQPATGSALLDAWLRIAEQLYHGASWETLEPAVLALGQRIAVDATAAGVELDGWRALVDLVRAEATGQASLRLRPLSALSPASPSWPTAMTRAIDSALADGDLTRATALAEEGATARPELVELTRRAVRLARRTDLSAEDGVTLVHAGEALYQRGAAANATRVFEVAEPELGTAAADHAARRLLQLQRPLAAARLTTPTSPLAAREHGAVALEQWAEAAEVWALRQDRRLGLTVAPPWADPGVRALLGPAHRALLDGDLQGAAELSGPAGDLVRAVLAEPMRLDAPPPRPQPTDIAALVQLMLATPDPTVPLVAALGLDDVVGALPLLRALAREVATPDWEGEAAPALAELVRRTQDAELAKVVDGHTLVGWLEGPDAQRAAAAEVILAHPSRAEAAGDRLDHAPARRIERALALLGEDRLPEAIAIAQSVLKKALPGSTRSQAAAVLAIAGNLEPLASALAPPRWDGGRMGLAFDVLLGIDSTREEGGPLPETLLPLVTGLHSTPVRLSLVRGLLLRQSA